jgi:preprotein translocase subunit SecG
MSALITLLHVFVCLVLVIAVLLQSGKSADLAGAFGGGGSQSTFGPRSAATILSKLTTICAVLFMVTSFGLWVLQSKGESSVMRGEEAPAAETTPATTTEQKQEGEQADPTKKKQETEAQGKVDEKKQPEKPEQKKTAPEKKKQDSDIR